jgi:serine protease
MYWAAGIEQPGLPVNPTPARILNLSLGGGGDCSRLYEEAVDAILARQSVIVAAAGNTSGRAVGAPANCRGVIAVTGLRHAGTKVGFADLGPEVALAAPGGNCVNTRYGEPCLYPLLSTSNRGLTEPEPGGSIYTDSFRFTVGTSFAAPLVSGTVALMLSVRPDLSPSQIRSFLQSTARPFPSEGADNGDDPSPVPVCQPPSGRDQLQCYCVTGLCGAGMLDAQAAVEAALTAPAGDTGGGSMSAAWLLALAGAAWVLACTDRQGRGGTVRRPGRHVPVGRGERVGDLSLRAGIDGRRWRRHRR